jgi:hypothetical protein
MERGSGTRAEREDGWGAELVGCLMILYTIFMSELGSGRSHRRGIAGSPWLPVVNFRRLALAGYFLRGRSFRSGIEQ